MSAADDTALRVLLPVGRSGMAIAAGYLALFSILLLPAPLALATGLLALRSLRNRPQLGGRGRAWFGVIMGGIFTLLLLALLIVMALSALSRSAVFR